MKVENRAAAGGCDGSISRIRHPRLGGRPRPRDSPCGRYGDRPCPTPLAPTETIAASPKLLSFEQRYVEAKQHVARQPLRNPSGVSRPPARPIVRQDISASSACQPGLLRRAGRTLPLEGRRNLGGVDCKLRAVDVARTR